MTHVNACRLSCLGLVLGLGTGGCSEFDLLPPTDLLYDGDTVLLFSEDGLTPCAGSGPSMEYALAFVTDEFRLGPAEQPIEVHWLTDDSFAELPCGNADVGACTFTDRAQIATRYVETEHELVHAYMGDRAPGPKHSFFREGLAVVYGRDPQFSRPDTDLREALSQGARIDIKHYPRAGHFVSFMLDEFGPEAVAGFVAATVDRLELEDVEPVFEETFGLRLDAFIELYEAAAPRCSSKGWNRLRECVDEPWPWQFPFRWEYEFDLDSESADVIDVYDGRVHRRAPLEVTEASTHTFLLGLGDVPEEYEGAYRAVLRSCAGCADELSIRLDGEMRSGSNVVLEPGRYIIDVSRTQDAPAPVTVTLRTP